MNLVRLRSLFIVKLRTAAKRRSEILVKFHEPEVCRRSTVGTLKSTASATD